MATETVDRVTDAASCKTKQSGEPPALRMPPLPRSERRPEPPEPPEAIRRGLEAHRAERKAQAERMAQQAAELKRTGNPMAAMMLGMMRDSLHRMSVLHLPALAQARRDASCCGACGEGLPAGAPVWLGRGHPFGPDDYEHGVMLPLCGACARRVADGERIPYVWLDRWFASASLRPDLPRSAAVAGRACSGCGRTVYSKGYPVSGRVYCSQRCQRAFWTGRQKSRRVRQRGGKTCPVCGQEFTGTRADQVTCSAACRQKAYRQRRAAVMSTKVDILEEVAG